MKHYANAYLLTVNAGIGRSSGYAAASDRTSRAQAEASGLDLALSVAAYRAITTIWDTVEGLRARMRARRVRNATLRELSALDDRLLADIGLTRDQLPAVVSSMVEASQEACGTPHAAGTPARAAALRA